MADRGTERRSGPAWLDPHERLRLAQEYSRAGDWTWDAATDEVEFSPCACEIFEISTCATTWTELRGRLHPDDAERARLAVEESIATGSNYDVEYRVVLRDGGLRWVSAKGRAMYSDAGVIAGMVGLVQDITDRKRAEEMLRDSEQRFRAMADDAPVMIWVTGPDGNCSYINRQWREFTGTTLEENLGLGWVRCVHPDDQHQAEAIFLASNAARSGLRVEYRLRRHDGRWRWALDSAVPRNSADGTFLGYIGSVIDISERKEYEDAVAASEARFRTLVNAVPQHVWTCTAEGSCDYVGAQYLDYTGVAAEQLYGADWLRCIHPDDVPRITADWQRSLSEAIPYDVETRIRGAAGSYRWFKTRALPLCDENGRVEKWLGTNTDVDDQKRSEAALLRANFDLSQFAYSASHDLQEPLRTVALYGQLLRKRHEPELSSGALELVTVIEHSAKRISALIKDLLAYTQTTSEAIASRAECDAGEALASVMADLRAGIDAARATVTTEHLPTVGVAAPHLHTVFVNLLSNAIKYRGAEAPHINISAERSADRWLFTVADNGIGIEDQYREQVFGMFKRLHSTQYPGTGMGLAICRKIVEHYGGQIWIESQPGGGTRFRFTLPHAAAQTDTLKNE